MAVRSLRASDLSREKLPQSQIAAVFLRGARDSLQLFYRKDYLFLKDIDILLFKIF